jgi:hypothetical protein
MADNGTVPGAERHPVPPDDPTRHYGGAGKVREATDNLKDA